MNIIRTSLKQQHCLLRILREKARDGRSRGATTDNDGIGELRKRR